MASQSPVERRPGLPAFLLSVIVLAVYGRIVAHGWVEFDDPLHVLENPGLCPVSWQSVAGFWHHAYSHLFIPLSYTLFAAEAAVARWLAGIGPTAPPPAAVFHLTSLVLHVAAVLVVRRLLVRFVDSPWAATAGAAVFATHPLQVETVAWVSEQRGLLASLLSLVAIEQFLRWQDAPPGGSGVRRSVFLAVAAYVCALLAKPTCITVPMMAWLLARARPSRSWQTTLMALAPWCVAAMTAALVTRAVQPSSLTTNAIALPARLLVAADALGFYVMKLILPWNLCVAYGRTPAVVLADPATPFVAAGVGCLAAAVALASPLRRWRLPAALFLVPLLPVLGLTPFVFQNQSTVADRYASMAMLGPALAVADCVARAAGNRAVRWVVVIGVGCLAGLAFRQVATWADTGTLAAHACRVEPRVTASWTLLGAHQRAQGDAAAARESARRALAIDGRNRIALLDLAAAAIRLGNHGDANEALARLRGMGMASDSLAMIFYNRGCTNLASGEHGEAAIDFQLAIRLDPGHPRAANNLGIALTRQGKWDEAEAVFRRRLDTVRDDAAAWTGLGNVLLVAGRAGAAVPCYDEALRVEPDDAATLLNRAAARVESGDPAGAADDLQAAIVHGGSPDPGFVRRVEAAVRDSPQ